MKELSKLIIIMTEIALSKKINLSNRYVEADGYKQQDKNVTVKNKK